METISLHWETKKNWIGSPVKLRGRIWPKAKDEKQIRILNLKFTWKDTGIEYEADQRHAEIVMKELGLQEDSREVFAPGDKRVGGSAQHLESNRSERQSFYETVFCWSALHFIA